MDSLSVAVEFVKLLFKRIDSQALREDSVGEVNLADWRAGNGFPVMGRLSIIPEYAILRVDSRSIRWKTQV